ncbi:MAG: tyrosine-type recombinase/integrase [Micavibrio sp.]|nr:tyrosine-type recombinase/integrase [Micavibrio sp.]
MPKITRKLTEAEIRNAKSQSSPYKLYDTEGLRLLIRPSGKKVWQYPYVFQKGHNVFTIGHYCPDRRLGSVGAAEARRIRDEVKLLLTQGIDPNKQKRLQRYNSNELSETTFEAIAREWHSKGTWAVKHKKNILSSLEADVFPQIGYKEIKKVATQDVVAVLSSVEQRKALNVAKRICQRCEAIFDYAMVKGLCANNPASGRAKFISSRPVQNRAHLKEGQVGEFLGRLEAYHGRDQIKLALQLLILTFVRPGELRQALWNEIDTEKAVWIIPSGRMKMRRDHIVPLSPQALRILEKLRKITGNSDFLFPSVRSPHKPISDVTLLKAVKIMGYAGESKIMPHGMRHTASTILNEHGFNRDVIERQLAHRDNNKIRSIYNHAEYLAERCKMMHWYGDHLDKLKSEYGIRRNISERIFEGSGQRKMR